MDAMPAAPAHAKPAPRDHLWVVAVIAACALLEVWASWVTIGSMSGFPRIGGKHGMPTDWILAVTTEAYWGYALYAWLAAAPGPRSRRFAMWSAVAVFALSLVGQAAAHLARPGAAPPPAVIVFVTALPVVVLALIAILIHMRQLDREAAAEAHAEAVVADERDELRAQLEALTAEVEPLRRGLAAAQHDAARANEKAESLAAKLTAQKPNRTRTKAPNAGHRKDPNAAPNGKPRTAPNAAPETEVPDDFDARAEALEIWLADPSISGKDLGARVGLGERWGQLRKTEFRNASAGSEPSEERS